METFSLAPEEVKALRVVHRQLSHRTDAYRINAIILLGTGWTQAEVSEALLLDERTIRRYVQAYQQGGVDALLEVHYQGSQCHLAPEQIQRLDEHLQEHLYGQAREAFVAQYRQLKEDKKPEDPIYFMDAVHPQHNSAPAYGWIKKGREAELKANCGRQRLNINGVIDIQTLQTVVQFDETIHAASTIALFQSIERKHRKAGVIYIIADNARYYRSSAVKEYLKNSRIKILFLPPYSPNLNLIERLWKYFRKVVMNNRYYETLVQFTEAAHGFFANIKAHRQALRSLLTENFHLFAA